MIIERIFAYPGIGNMAIEAVINRDLPLIQGLACWPSPSLFIVINIAVDLLVALFNPRTAALMPPQAREPRIQDADAASG